MYTMDSSKPVTIGIPDSPVLDVLADAIAVNPMLTPVRLAVPALLALLQQGDGECALLPVHLCPEIAKGRVLPGLGLASSVPVAALDDFYQGSAPTPHHVRVYGLWVARLGAPLAVLRQSLALASRAATDAASAAAPDLRFQLGGEAIEAARGQLLAAIADGHAPPGSRLIFC